MNTIKVNSGLQEIQEYLKENNINFRMRIQESFDGGIFIDLIGITIGTINIILELKKWIKNKKKTEKLIIVINNIEINVNDDSEEVLRSKLKD
jgi:hypothetical protein